MVPIAAQHPPTKRRPIARHNALPATSPPKIRDPQPLRNPWPPATSRIQRFTRPYFQGTFRGPSCRQAAMKDHETWLRESQSMPVHGSQCCNNKPREGADRWRRAGGCIARSSRTSRHRGRNREPRGGRRRSLWFSQWQRRGWWQRDVRERWRKCRCWHERDLRRCWRQRGRRYQRCVRRRAWEY
jgi:hypothetical protein